MTVDAARGVEVVLPRRAAEREAAAAIRELRPWIERRMARARARARAVAARGDTVPYLGTMLRLVPEPGRTRVHRRGDELLVPAGAERMPALERWYRRAARTRSRRGSTGRAHGRRSYSTPHDPRAADALGELLARPAR